jgi:antitoxin MazE
VRITKIQKWGNSQRLRLSKHVLRRAGIAIGDAVQIIVSNCQITVKKTDSKYDLAELIARIPKGYKSTEVNFGLPIGKEEW